MQNRNNDIEFLLHERTKVLNCLFKIEDRLNRSEISLRQAINTVLEALPQGFQYSEYCQAKIVYNDIVYQISEFEETPWFITTDIIVEEQLVGKIFVYYTKEFKTHDGTPFLEEEKKLLKTVAERLGHFILHQKLKSLYEELQTARQEVGKTIRGEWKIVLDMIRKTDPNLFMSLMRKLLNLLCWKGSEEAELLMKHTNISRRVKIGLGDEELIDENKPTKVEKIINYDEYVERIQRLADDHLPDEVILNKIQKEHKFEIL